MLLTYQTMLTQNMDNTFINNLACKVVVMSPYLARYIAFIRIYSILAQTPFCFSSLVLLLVLNYTHSAGRKHILHNRPDVLPAENVYSAGTSRTSAGYDVVCLKYSGRPKSYLPAKNVSAGSTSGRNIFV